MNDTILILGEEADEHAAHMVEYLASRGHDVELLDGRWFPETATIAFDPLTRDGVIGLPRGRRVGFSEVRAVYWRNYGGALSPSLPDPEQAWIAQNDARGLFESLLIELAARWVNGWDAFRLHQTKPVQLARVAALGVRVPSTLITNDAAMVRDFAQRHARTIVKPVQGGDHTQPLTAAHLRPENLANLHYAPITLQDEMPGTNVRVFVAGDRLLACEVRTSRLDYRADPEPELLVHGLPDEMQATSRRIARELALLWTGIDFRLTPEGEYVFLEANPSPMFLGFEAQTGLPLSAALADLLVGM